MDVAHSFERVVLCIRLRQPRFSVPRQHLSNSGESVLKTARLLALSMGLLTNLASM